MNKQILIQLAMLNNSNAKICKSIENLDCKMQVIMKTDSRMRALAMFVPVLPSAFINIMPVKSIDELEIVENYLSGKSEDGINYKEELVSLCTRIYKVIV